MKDARYALTVLLKTSTCALHWGWAGVVFVCCTFSSENNLFESLLTNSFQPSLLICTRMPNLQNHSVQMVLVTVSASLFSTAMTNAYFVKASVMHRMYLCWCLAASIGPKRFLIFNCSSIGSGWSNGGLAVDVHLCWHWRHILGCFSTSEYTLGQK